MSKSLQSQAPLKDLPIASVVDEVLEALHSGNVLLHAEPGAGKSTGMPLALLQGAGIAGKIIMLEPRRLAARGVAERLAAQLGESVGERIGLRMRGMTRTSSSTRLEVVTEGVLTRMLQADPSLEGIDLVILDEFHERSLHADLGLALCLEVQNALRPELRLLLMSATLAMENLHQHLHQATRIFCAARQFPVSIIWVGESQQALALRVSNVVLKAINEHQGDVLVFLPGVAEIEKTATQLAPRLGEQQVICRLHSGVSVNEQRAATAPSSSAVRRIILSTSIAETSLTIDGVCIVVDAGLERRGRVDSRSGAVLLETIKSNQSSATQRSGRAGRTAPGVCYRLWSEEGHGRRAENWQAEIQRADLAPLLMELKLWGVNSVAQLPWLEPPPPAALARAEDLLERLGILELGQLTQHGRAVARLPLHPRLGHMMIWAAQKGAGELSCSLAVLLDDLDRRREQVDVEILLKNSPGKQQQERIKRLARELSGELPPSETTSDAPSLG
ncbi:MAG: DEAD/DEAH box helicase, partial [Granulosicoccus sp.]|nr:DEAD/DEAH box helicase [Granulosicoccus sp.]